MFGNKERLSYLWDMNETNTHPKVGMTIKGYTLKGFNRSAVKNYPGLPKGHRFYTALLEDNKGNRRCLQYIPATFNLGRSFEKVQNGWNAGSRMKTWNDCDLNFNF